MTAIAEDVAQSDTPLRAVFKINLNGQTVSITTVGQAYRFITNLSSIEWIEFRAARRCRSCAAAGRRQCHAERAGDRRAAHAVRPRQTVVSPYVCKHRN